MKYIKLLALSLLMIMGRGVASAETIDLKVGEYLDVAQATRTGSLKEDVKDNVTGLGSIQNGDIAEFTLTNSTAVENAYLSFMEATANGSSEPKIKVEITSGNFNVEKFVDFTDINDWNFNVGGKHLLSLGTLPAGDVTLKFTFSNNGSYVGNIGKIVFYSGIPDSYTQEPNNYVPLNNGRYPGNGYPRAISNSGSEGGYKVGFIGTSGSCSYDFYATEGGRYNLCMAMKRDKGGTMNVKITDQETGEIEVNQDIEITEDLAKGYGNEVAMLLENKLTKGAKTLRLSFTAPSNYLMDFENLRLTKADYTLNVSEAKAATLVLPFAATIPTGVKAYKLTAVTDDNKLTCEEVTGTLPANTPVLVNAEKGEYTFEVAETVAEEDAPTSGLLTGVWEETEVPAGAYVLQRQNGNVAFYKVAEGSTIKVKANQAYLALPEASKAAFYSLDFGGATTGIAGVEVAKKEKDEAVYDLQGVRVGKNNLPKVYIKGGKKIVNK